jgi:hypothetical protein
MLGNAKIDANDPCETFDRLDLLRKSAYDLVERIGSQRPAMKRREFITLVGFAVGWPIATNAQQVKKVPRIGVLWHADSADQRAKSMRLSR